MADDETLRFYARNAPTYAQHRTGPTGERLAAFLSAMPPGARILELGCGNGLDAAHMLEQGFDVDATDGTPELVAEASKRIGGRARIMRFEDLDAETAYDGVWACASLLHVPAVSLPDILGRIHRTLRPGGTFVASFKAGNSEGRDALGRYYNYLDSEQLRAHLTAAASWGLIDISENDGSGYDGKPTRWLWLHARKA